MTDKKTWLTTTDPDLHVFYDYSKSQNRLGSVTKLSSTWVASVVVPGVPDSPFAGYQDAMNWVERMCENIRPDKFDSVEKPKHYNSHPSGVECITVTRHMNFNLGNVIKYLWRAGIKTEVPLEDLKKARWYLDDEIKRLETK